jgi:hypothetical protein
VAGFLAVIEDVYNGSIYNCPDLAKAITMASATHDVEGDNQFDERGAGCIDTSSGVEIIENDQWITDSFYEGNSAQDYSIELQQGDTVQIALCWRSDATQANWELIEDVQSDINFSFYIYELDGGLLHAEGENDRAWQFIDTDQDDVTVEETGSYDLKVWNDRWEADSSYRHFSIAWAIK